MLDRDVCSQRSRPTTPVDGRNGCTVPFVDLAREHHHLVHRFHDCLSRVQGASAFILGREVEEFERAFAAYCGVADAVGVSSGTAALRLALQAAGIGRGDEVIVPAHTFVATAHAVILAGAHPVLADVHPETGLIDPAAVEDVVTTRTAAVIPVHLYGQLCDMEALAFTAKRCQIAIVEDAAQAHGATVAGRRAGSFGLAGAFSFYPSKNLGALGDGGAVCTNDSALARRLRALRDLGRGEDGTHVAVGGNDRLDGLQAAFLKVKLAELDGRNDQRRRLAKRYQQRLPREARPLARVGEDNVFHLFPVRVTDRNSFREFLEVDGIQTGIHYSLPLQAQPSLKGYFAGATSCPVAAEWAGTEVSLPMFSTMSIDEVDRVATVADRYFASSRTGGEDGES